jgi:hypothetical protein
LAVRPVVRRLAGEAQRGFSGRHPQELQPFCLAIARAKAGRVTTRFT